MNSMGLAAIKGSGECLSISAHSDSLAVPGVMLASAVRRLIVREGVRPGRRAVLVAPDGAPDGLAAMLRDAGVEVVARCAPLAVEAIHGRSSVTGVTVAGRRLACDLVVVDAGRRPADELARQADVSEEPRVG
jgi:sarcosine oxidase subunit alpha